MKPRLIRASYFAWTLVPAAAFAVHQAYGLPHMLWSYDFQGTRADSASRRYTRCTFVGPYGKFTVYPETGECGSVAFFKEKDARQ